MEVSSNAEPPKMWYNKRSRKKGSIVPMKLSRIAKAEKARQIQSNVKGGYAQQALRLQQHGAMDQTINKKQPMG